MFVANKFCLFVLFRYFDKKILPEVSNALHALLFVDETILSYSRSKFADLISTLNYELTDLEIV